MEDKIIVREFLKHRSERAFIRLYRSKTPYLYRTALRLTQDEHEARELIQQMWIIAAEKLDTFAWRSSLNTWLCAILLNRFRNTRHKQGYTMHTLDPERTDLSRTNSEMTGTATDLESAIGQLPPGYRQIIILHDIEGYTHREIADMLEISEGTSKSQLFNARRSVREYFAFDTTKHNRHESR